MSYVCWNLKARMLLQAGQRAVSLSFTGIMAFIKTSGNVSLCLFIFHLCCFHLHSCFKSVTYFNHIWWFSFICQEQDLRKCHGIAAIDSNLLVLGYKFKGLCKEEKRRGPQTETSDQNINKLLEHFYYLESYLERKTGCTWGWQLLQEKC